MLHTLAKPASLFAFLPTLISALTIPNIAPPQLERSSLAKRGGQVLYLANCYRESISNWGDVYKASYGAWYANVDDSQNQEVPDALSNEYRDWSNGGDYLHWEGQEQDIYFGASGTTVATNINWNAQDGGFQSYAGSAHRWTDGYNFNCYKDDSRTLFLLAPNDGTDRAIDCWSIYYCV